MSFRLYINNLENGDYHIGFFNGNKGKYIRTVERFAFANITSMIEIFIDSEVELSIDLLKRIIKDCYSQIEELEAKKVYNLSSKEGRIEFVYEPGFGDNAENLINEIEETIHLLSKKGRNIKLL